MRTASFPRPRRSVTSFVLALAALVAMATPVVGAERKAPINPKDPPQGRFSDDWMELHIGGSKAGFAHSTMSREGDRIRSELSFNLKLGRAEQPVAIAMTQGTIETVAGEPIEFWSQADMATMKTATKGQVRDGKVTITTSQLGLDQTRTYDFPKGAVMTWGAYRESVIRGFAPGLEYTLDMYSPELRLDGSVKAHTRVGDMEKFNFRGEERSGRRVAVKIETHVGEMEMLSWVDENGEPLKVQVPTPGIGDFVMYTCDEAVALADFAPPEFFMTTVLPATKRIDRAKANKIVYRLRARPGGPSLGAFPSTPAQFVRQSDDGAVEITVSRMPIAAEGESVSPETASPDYLESNLMINTEDPVLVDLARKAAGDERDPVNLADKLRRFVTEHVADKSLNIGFATASEVARTREGDCSEHGVLLAALGRLNKIPSRVVVGLAYVPFFGNQDDIFGYHMWTQFFINGRWVDVDAALRETECSPARIAFAISSLKDAGLADLSLPLLAKLGSIELEIVSVDPASAATPIPGK